MVMEFLKSELCLLTFTFAIYFGAQQLQRRSGLTLLNPVLITILAMIGILKLLGVDYATYSSGCSIVEFWLKPAIVALGLPLYLQFSAIRKDFMPILVSQVIGCLIGLISVVGIARLMGASRDVIVSLAPKSVTTPIAIEISTKLDGVPSLTAAIVVCVGLFGAIAGFRVLSLGHVASPIARSLSMGTAAHVIGTSRVSELGERASSYATVGLILNGVLTAILAEPVIRLMGV